MGVKGLWSMLESISKKSTLYDLQGNTVAIDLSCWICEDQCVGEKYEGIQSQMHLRNLFFRTSTLLLSNITPVFVLEGEAPEMKYQVMADRVESRFNRKNLKSNGSRKRFRTVLKKCQKMLEMMGVLCVQAEGEAEALCGQLSAQKVVSGVITQDSDVFLYGARVVYRNLQVKGGVGFMEVYDMDDIEAKLNINREKLVAMSLLCGCDYDLTGVFGIGKETTFRYLENFEGDILERMKNVRRDAKLMKYEEERNGCSRCSHTGRLTDHKKEGCLECGCEKGCLLNDSPLLFKNLDEPKKKLITFELSLRQKILNHPDFPNETTISEFFKPIEIFHNAVRWTQPNLVRFVQFSSDALDWKVEYAFEKMLILVARWQILNKNFEHVDFQPVKVVKRRVVKGVASVEVAWKAIASGAVQTILDLLPDDVGFRKEDYFITVEPISLISEKFKELYNKFLDSTNKKGNNKQGKKKGRKAELSGVEDIFEKLNIGDEPKEQRELVKLCPENNFECNFDIEATFSESFCDVGSTAKNSKKVDQVTTVDLTNSTFGDDTLPVDDSDFDEHDLSRVIDNIIARRQFY